MGLSRLVEHPKWSITLTLYPGCYFRSIVVRQRNEVAGMLREIRRERREGKNSPLDDRVWVFLPVFFEYVGAGGAAKAAISTVLLG